MESDQSHESQPADQTGPEALQNSEPQPREEKEAARESAQRRPLVEKAREEWIKRLLDLFRRSKLMCSALVRVFAPTTRMSYCARRGTGRTVDGDRDRNRHRRDRARERAQARLPCGTDVSYSRHIEARERD